MKRHLVAGPVLALAFLAAGATAPLAAQEADVLGEAELTGALESHRAAAEADRAAVDRVLSTEEARRAAESIGVDVERARTAARVLEGDRLEEAARLARAVEDPLAGGQTISFNATTLIIILLLVIIVVLIAN